ncbi:MAG: helix-turn-helix domain-containing protein [Paracoccus sp. (in: a-proteobacteria)]|nr:helix-turn-helix domain-containing protein [Paracoccus sp. (in: a-proteobacteria)]
MIVQRDSTRRAVGADLTRQLASIVANAYFPLDIGLRAPDRFHGSMERRHLGPVLLTHLKSEVAEYERSRSQLHDVQTQDFLIAIPFASSVRFKQFGRDVRCPPGDFVLESGGEPYLFAYDKANDLSAVKIGHRALTDCIRRPERLCAYNIDASDGLGALLIATIRRAHMMSLDNAAADVIGHQLIELLVLALDRHAEISTSANSLVRMGHLGRAEAFIKRRISDTAMTPHAVAEGCGISIRYLHAIFADANRSVTPYIREQRLLAARDLLRMPEVLKMVDIAYRLGFSDQAILSRQFRDRFGMTPSAFRA